MNEGKKIPSWNFFLLKKALYVQKKILIKYWSFLIWHNLDWYICSRVIPKMKMPSKCNLHLQKSKLDLQWPTCPKRTWKELETLDLQSCKVFPSAQGKMGWNGQPFSGFHTSKKANAFKLSYVWEVPWESNLSR